jgi:hypothetical protein
MEAALIYTPGGGSLRLARWTERFVRIAKESKAAKKLAKAGEAGKKLVGKIKKVRKGKRAERGAKAGEESRILANKAAGDAAADAIANRYPGAIREKTFQTTLGSRRVDILTQDGLAIESKLGRTSLTSSIKTQIAKDRMLLRNPEIRSVEWVFSRSSTTGAIGPTGPLQAALREAKITWRLA